ncbi:alpha-amylase family glycosyl hydrolase [Brumicola nitratireducens]|nr:alpha-amylase family glycosyl hydrolase [Glaciecola nitratireducens]
MNNARATIILKYPVIPHVKHSTPLWASNASIYQVNVRQFSPSGTFKAVNTQLLRLKQLGVSIIWLMPIHEIGQVKRKGTLGSPYAVKDYYSINAELGTDAELKELIEHAHELELKVILDWVPNHSAWDNKLVTEHPHWYARDYKGDFRPAPWWDWDDIIEFDYSQPDLREYMIDAMSYWVRKFDVDGFRCDVAGYIPNDFWRQAREALDEIKPVFMLAEWENRDLHEYAFDMTYAWSWNEVLHDIVHERASLDKLRKYYSWNERAWPKEAMRMTFVSNHDENAWEGTPSEKFGDAEHACIVLSCLGQGMPLIHNGQEAGETKRLAFFEKDCIEWQEHSTGALYTQLLSLRQRYTALWNAEHGALMHQVPNNHQQAIFSFVRQDSESKWFMIFNFSNEHKQVSFKEDLFTDEYIDVFESSPCLHDLFADFELDLEPWEYRIFMRKY